MAQDKVQIDSKPVLSIIEKLDEQFQEPSTNFFKFLENNRHIKKWIIASDYCLHDKNKPNDTMALTIIPCDDIKQLMNNISILSPKDIKSTSVIDKKFLEYLNSARLFHLCIIYEKSDMFVSSKQDAEAQIDRIIGMIEDWKTKTDNKDSIKNYNDWIKKFNKFKNETQKGSFNVRLFQEMVFLNIMVSYFSALIATINKANVIGWASDRDTMVEAYNSIIFDIVAINYHGICEYKGYDSDQTKLMCFVQELIEDEAGKELKNMWYDELVRLPDYIAGTFADLDINSNKSTKNKFIQVIEDVAADSNFLELRKIGFKKDGYIIHKYYKIQSLPNNKVE